MYYMRHAMSKAHAAGVCATAAHKTYYCVSENLLGRPFWTDIIDACEEEEYKKR